MPTMAQNHKCEFVELRQRIAAGSQKLDEHPPLRPVLHRRSLHR